jgi:hypothetical protein
VTQELQHLSSKPETLSSNPSTANLKKRSSPCEGNGPRGKHRNADKNEEYTIPLTVNKKWTLNSMVK